ncbi:unnamed protein product, partial [Prunus brigantina]
KYDRNLGKRCRRSEGKNLEKNEGEKGVYNLVVGYVMQGSGYKLLSSDANIPKMQRIEG